MNGPDRERRVPFNPLTEADEPPVAQRRGRDPRWWDVATVLATVVGIVLIILVIVAS